MAKHNNQYRLTRKGRLAVVYGAVNEIQNGAVGATMTQVARYMKIEPSTYVMNLLQELRKEGVIYFMWDTRLDGKNVREWFIRPPSGKLRTANHE